jgi:anti-sigma factor RsiW
MMNHDEIRENLPAYVLGGLEPDAARAVEEHLRGCDSCRRELASYELPIYALDLSVPEASPPEGARERLLARAELGRASTDEEPEGQTEAPRQIPGRQSRLPWILAASLIVAILLGGAPAAEPPGGRATGHDKQRGGPHGAPGLGGSGPPHA